MLVAFLVQLCDYVSIEVSLYGFICGWSGIIFGTVKKAFKKIFNVSTPGSRFFRSFSDFLPGKKVLPRGGTDDGLGTG